ncbi:MAG: flagellar hook-basal body complex protein FliE [bacterium]
MTPISPIPPMLGAPAPPGPTAPGAASGGGFVHAFGSIVTQAATLERTAEGKVAQLAQGEGDIAGTMLALNQADLAVGLLVQVRDRIVKAYQDMMSMPV